MGVEWATTTAAVTGAASGIGRALSVELALRGAEVAISDVDPAGLEGTLGACRQAGARGRVSQYQLDVADRAAVLDHADRVASTSDR